MFIIGAVWHKKANSQGIKVLIQSYNHSTNEYYSDIDSFFFCFFFYLELSFSAVCPFLFSLTSDSSPVLFVLLYNVFEWSLIQIKIFLFLLFFLNHRSSLYYLAFVQESSKTHIFLFARNALNFTSQHKNNMVFKDDTFLPLCLRIINIYFLFFIIFKVTSWAAEYPGQLICFIIRSKRHLCMFTAAVNLKCKKTG